MNRLKCLCLFFFFSTFQFLFPFPSFAQYTRYQEPEFLTYDELVKLSENPDPGGALGKKLQNFWTTPIISNEAYYRGIKPHHPSDDKLGSFLRVASWNIEKSYHIDRVINLWLSEASYKAMIAPELAQEKPNLYKKMLQQRERLTTADILVLQEMDIGVKRSDYRNAAAELAKALDMNYTYGAEQLEIDPVLLGTEKVLLEDGTVDEDATAMFKVDPEKVKGVFGSAVLSRYPIKKVEVFQLKHQAYDWYHGEQNKVSFLEKSRRFGTKVAFQNHLTRELKVGGRIYFRVDLDVPQLKEKTLTIINIHLEIKCRPEGRTEQMGEILSYIRKINHPVIVLGDFNAANEDLSPTSVKRLVTRTAKNPTTWLSAGISYISPHGLLINTTRGVSNVTKNYQNPFAKDMRIVAPNPQRKMFMMIKDYKFEDGGVFDFRGDLNRSINQKQKMLANSNQRGRKGFKTSFQVRRPIGIIGKYRLDWVFVKSYMRGDPENPELPYKFAPHFGETLEEMNDHLMTSVSDHHPNVIDLPFEEPKSL